MHLNKRSPPASHLRRWSVRVIITLLILVGVVPSMVSAAAVAPPHEPTSDPGKQPAKPPGPTATLANVAYGPHARQRLDFWRPAGQSPTPVVIFFHGGSWQRGTRSSVEHYGLARYLAAGIAVVAADYRFIDQARAAGVQPPVQWPLADAARAVQFVRSKAGAWGIDGKRIGLSGSSAGACSALWLGMHDDLANPTSTDPIERESTRVACVGVNEAQSTLDPRQIRLWFKQVPSYGYHAFGINKLSKEESLDSLFARAEVAREVLVPWIAAYSPYAQASADDPPIALFYPKKPPGDTVHGAMFGVKLQERLQELGVSCQTVFPGGTVERDYITFLIDSLTPRQE